jgi:uncharacterized membrane protein YeiH
MMAKSNSCMGSDCRPVEAAAISVGVFPFSDTVFGWYDLGAAFLWALSGAMLAARKGFDVVGIFIVALVSSTGGGLLRDGLFLQGHLPRLIQTPNYLIIVTVVTAIIVVFGGTLRRIAWLPRLLTLADALGIGAYGVVGMYLAQSAGINTMGAILIGVVNAVGGGALRDLLVGDRVELLQPAVWMGIASVMGCVLFAILLELGVAGPWAGAAGALSAFAIRLIALHFNLRSRPLRAFKEDWHNEGERP